MKILLFFIVLLVVPEENKIKEDLIAGIKGYNFSKPDGVWRLPSSLKEISGMVLVDENSCACIQDENGKIFIYDLLKRSIIQEIHFNEDGDYEDIASVGNSVFVLRSDGTLFKIPVSERNNFKVTSLKTKVPSEDNEGLCYDPVVRKLLIGCKGKIDKEKFNNKRAIFSYDFKTESLSSEPFLIIDPESIKTSLKKNKLITMHNDDDHDLDFKISAIAVHPVSKKIFVISASDYLVCVFNRAGDPENIEFLDHKLFNKAEGITFLPNGDIFVSNEGEDGEATILKFKYNSKL